MFFKTHIAISLILLSITESKPISYVLSCGNRVTVEDADHRKWSSDEKFLSSGGESTTATAQFQDPSLPSTVPYMTARIFTSPKSYSFSVSPNGRHWVRLHFYPANYDDFEVSDSRFSVLLDEFTLLNNFSASITAQALTQAYIIREFTVFSAKNGFLNLTFIPSSSSSMAFINGIEVIPMPEIFQTFIPMVGFSGQSISPENSTLQTMYRLNVGGQFIPAKDDSGDLGRTWYDDSPYLFGAAAGVTSEAEKNFTIRFPATLPEKIAAPADVYRTARTMGPTPKVNLNYNLTWVFRVDGNFTYVVRLHFCEFVYSKANQRVFHVYINNETAQANADVVAWSHSKGVPVYKDFAVYFNGGGGGGGGGGDLWVALHPSEPMKPEFMDAILNGIEIFKINDTSGNLAGPNPEISRLQRQNPGDGDHHRAFSVESRSGDLKRILGGIAGGLSGIVLVTVLFIFLKSKKRKLPIQPARHIHKSSGWLPLYDGSSRRSNSAASNRYNLSGCLCRHFSLAEIRYATNNFHESQVIGEGGFGKVYKGIVEGNTEVAIKRSNPSSQQGAHEFQTEIELLSKLRHKHLVSLIGACEEGDEMILVYDYMANGTLREHLYKTDLQPLPWKQRLEICIGAVRGLHYLHTGAKYTIIHRDVKTTNILLDEKWVAKVSDFGLSKTGPALNQKTHVSTMVKGSFGYLDPEYFRRQQLTEKSDVYSFGVVLFEVLCGRPAISPNLPKEQVSLADWALRNFRGGNIYSIIDRNITKEEISRDCVDKFVEIAVKCLADQGTDRPSMGNVLWNLEYAMQLLKNGKQKQDGDDDDFVAHTTLLSIEEDGVETEDSNSSSNAVFSQIMNPRGR